MPLAAIPVCLPGRPQKSKEKSKAVATLAKVVLYKSMEPPILIRKATPADAAPIAACLLLAMEDIVCTFIGSKDANAAAAFLLCFTQQQANQYSYQNCWVAEVAGQVVAAANVYDGALLATLRQPVLNYILRFNPGFAPEDETGPGEYYIDTLGVLPAQQGKGIGTKLLQFLIDDYAGRRQPLGLLVDEENPQACRLYLKLGFVPAGKKRLFGKKMTHLQLRG